MADIEHVFPIQAPPAQVFDALSTPTGLDAWWSLECSGTPEEGARYVFEFGPGYSWSAHVARLEPGRTFDLRFDAADADWTGTRVGFALEPGDGGGTLVRFRHTDWPEANEHWRVSCFCWAMYLRLLKRYVERGEVVPYAERLDA